MKNSIILIIAIIAAQSINNEAQSYTISYYGSISCKKWSEERKNEMDAKSPGDWILAGSSLRWILGYLSGMNKMNQKGKDVLSSINSSLVADWTDMFCHENEDKDISDAADELFKKLSH